MELLIWLATMLPVLSILALALACCAPAGANNTPYLLESNPCSDFADVDAAVSRFAKILTFRTVSSSATPNHATDTEEFLKLHAWLEESYPLVYNRLRVEKVGAGTLDASKI